MAQYTNIDVVNPDLVQGQQLFRHAVKPGSIYH
jgi:hypothetical protein